MGKKVRVLLHGLVDKHEISIRELGRSTDIRSATLNELANQKRENIHFKHIEKIADEFDITDIREIITLVDTDEDD